MVAMKKTTYLYLNRFIIKKKKHRSQKVNISDSTFKSQWESSVQLCDSDMSVMQHLCNVRVTQNFTPNFQFQLNLDPCIPHPSPHLGPYPASPHSSHLPLPLPPPPSPLTRFFFLQEADSCQHCGGSGCAPCSLCHGSKLSMLANRFNESISDLRCQACYPHGLERCQSCSGK